MDKRIRNHRGSYDYFFAKPEAKGNVHKTAQKLIGIKRIREVSITEGDYGFVVKADLLYKEGADSLNKEIRKIVGGSSSRAVCRCQYSKL